MIYVVLLMGVLVVVFFLKYMLQKQQLKSFSQQLQQGQVASNYQKICYSSKDKQIEQLASEINELIQHKKDIQASDIRKETSLKEAIASMSHDLRTPLTAIIGYLQLLEKEQLTDKERQYLMAANNRAHHLEKLINNFFSLSVVEATDELLSIAEIHLNELIQEVVFTFYDNFQEFSIEPQFKLTAEPVIILGDEAASYRVIENIVLNVLQHATLSSSQDQAKVNFELVTDNHWATLTVKNTFSNEVIDETKVFHKFYTGDVSRKKRGGLGLTIVKNLMKKMAGEVAVFTKDGMFTIVCRFKLAQK